MLNLKMATSLTFGSPPEVSPERTALLDSMMHCTDVEVVVRVKE